MNTFQKISNLVFLLFLVTNSLSAECPGFIECEALFVNEPSSCEADDGSIYILCRFRDTDGEDLIFNWSDGVSSDDQYRTGLSAGHHEMVATKGSCSDTLYFDLLPSCEQELTCRLDTSLRNTGDTMFLSPRNLGLPLLDGEEMSWDLVDGVHGDTSWSTYVGNGLYRNIRWNRIIHLVDGRVCRQKIEIDELRKSTLTASDTMYVAEDATMVDLRDHITTTGGLVGDAVFYARKKTIHPNGNYSTSPSPVALPIEDADGKIFRLYLNEWAPIGLDFVEFLVVQEERRGQPDSLSYFCDQGKIGAIGYYDNGEEINLEAEQTVGSRDVHVVVYAPNGMVAADATFGYAVQPATLELSLEHECRNDYSLAELNEKFPEMRGLLLEDFDCYIEVSSYSDLYVGLHDNGAFIMRFFSFPGLHYWINFWVKYDSKGPEINPVTKVVKQDSSLWSISINPYLFDQCRVESYYYTVIDPVGIEIDYAPDEFPLRVYEEGQYVVRVTAFDELGNQSDTTIVVEVLDLPIDNYSLAEENEIIYYQGEPEQHYGREQMKEEDTEIEIFPNPFRDTFTIRTNGVISIFDSKGSKMMSKNIVVIDVIDARNWPSGIYFLITEDGGNIMLLKQ